MRFVGIDLHKRSMTVCVFDKTTGETFDRRFLATESKAIVEFFRGLGPFAAVLEATATYEWLWELLEPLAARLLLAHPRKLAVIAESMKKSDKHDAHFLAWLLAMDSVPEAHRPLPRRRQYQHLVKHRAGLVKLRTRVKNQIRAVLAARNLDRPGIFTAKGKALIAEANLSVAERFRVDDLLRSLEGLEERIKVVERELKRFRAEAPEEEKKAHAIVSSVPGVGELTADVVLSTLGDVNRFPNAKKCAAYAGLAPGFRESDQTRKELGITKEGPAILRWSLVEAAWAAIRYSRYWREQFERLAARRGRKKAAVAVGRRLLAVIYGLLKKGVSYSEAAHKAQGDPLPKPPTRGKMKFGA